MPRYLFIVIAAFSLVFTLFACSSMPKGRDALTVFAAASLNDAFREIGKAFEKSHPDTVVQFNFSGSQDLSTQLQTGAQADVFASANWEELQHVIDAGLVDQNTAQVFVYNQLVVILPLGNPAGLVTLADLARPGLKLVLAAEDVPAGRYARQVLVNLNGTYGSDQSPDYSCYLLFHEMAVNCGVKKLRNGI